jgi:acetate kinase
MSLAARLMVYCMRHKRHAHMLVLSYCRESRRAAPMSENCLTRISTGTAPVAVRVIRTDEESVIATLTIRLLESAPAQEMS